MLKRCAEIWDEVRNKKPLVHCMTNYVTMNDVANIILAAGASPAMCDHPEEAPDFARLAGSLYFNLGTLTSEKKAAMIDAAVVARETQKPVLIDPVACGVIARKKEVTYRLLAIGSIGVIKGNGAEIKSLAGMESQARGVDSIDKGEGTEEACAKLAATHGLVVTATGEIDVVAAPGRAALLANGTPLYQEITGAGCMAGGVMAACLAVAPGEAWAASVSGLTAFNIAGERAARLAGMNPGTFRTLVFDQLYKLRGQDLVKEGRVEW